MIGIMRELDALADPEAARLSARFFKTGKGEYGEGDVFLGLSVPQMRKVVKRHLRLPMSDMKKLLGSKVHEHRLVAFLILVERYERSDEGGRKEVYDFYMRNTKRANNWDLVDCSAGKIAGPYLMDRDKSVLYRLARSENLWERRIAIISTHHFIRNHRYGDTLRIAELLLDDKHDLIHKAVGWMLREVGKRGGLREEKAFLDKHRHRMPRTMLRYAIERFSPSERKRYMA